MLSWSLIAIISRMLCMLRMGSPISTVGIPRRAETVGPTVEPQGMSFRVTNTWSAPKATYSVTTNIWSGTASGRYIKNAPAALYLVTGDIYMTGGGNDDHLEILIGD